MHFQLPGLGAPDPHVIQGPSILMKEFISWSIGLTSFLKSLPECHISLLFLLSSIKNSREKKITQKSPLEFKSGCSGGRRKAGGFSW